MKYLLLFLLLITTLGYGEIYKIKLEDGTILEGEIISDPEEDIITFETVDGNIRYFNRSKIVGKSESISLDKDQPEELSPTFALLSSMVFVGMGQYYNGEPEKGLGMQVVAIGGILGMIIGADMNNDPKYEDDSNLSKGDKLIATGLIFSSAAILWSWFDAPASATRINRENGFLPQEIEDNQFEEKSFEYDNYLKAPGFSFSGTERLDGVKATFTFNF